MATALGIWNHIAAEGHTAKNAIPTSNSTNGPSSSSGDESSSESSASISANDFLVLLVTEMKNQDPTANTDPNEYINQLVQVNSLQQLISINQTLSADSNGTAPTAESRLSQNGINAPAAIGDSRNVSQATAEHSASHHILPNQIQSVAAKAVQGSGVRHSTGNLSIPEVNPSAQRAARSLSGRARVT